MSWDAIGAILERTDYASLRLQSTLSACGQLVPQILNAFFHQSLLLPNSQRHISTESVFYTLEDWKRRGTGAFYSILSIPYGRYWWANLREWYASVNPEMAALGNAVWENLKDKRYTCGDYPAGYSKWIQNEPQ